jgi:Flp pilus assembly pilin Flp
MQRGASMVEYVVLVVVIVAVLAAAVVLIVNAVDAQADQAVIDIGNVV